MNEQRRASSAPTSGDVSDVVPEALRPPLDEAPPGDPGATAARAAVRDSASPAARRRGRTTVRIPDDEVVRPQVESAEPAPVRALSNPPATPEPMGVVQDAPQAVAYDGVERAAHEASQGVGHDTAPGIGYDAALAGAVMPTRIISIESDAPPAPSDVDTAPVLSDVEEAWLPSSPSLEDGDEVEIVAHVQIDREASEPAPPLAVLAGLDEPATLPVLPGDPSTPKVLGADEEEIRFEDDAPTPALPPVEAAAADGERRSDPGDAPEISAEDMVAVESAPSIRTLLDLPPMRPRLASQPAVPPPPSRPVAPPAARTPLVIVPPHVGNMGSSGPESIGARRKGRLWWEELFNDDYVRTMEKLTDAQIAREVDFIETSLGLERGGAMLDLACGTGRQAIELARRGYEVVAFDLSLQMLARAGDEAQAVSAKLNFVQGDMREMTFAEQFDGVYSWNTAFGYFDEEKNANVIDRVHHALKKGGLFLLDVVNRDFIVRQSPSLAWFEGDGCICMDEMAVDFITSRLKVKRTLMLEDGRSRETEYSMRVYSLHELGRILHEHGFKVCEVSGRLATPGVFFGNESPRTIILAEKR